MRNALRTAESSQRGYLFTGNEIYLAPYSGAKSTAAREFETLKQKIAPSSKSAAVLARLASILVEKIADMDESIAFKKNRHDDQAVVRGNTHDGPKHGTPQRNIV